MPLCKAPTLSSRSWVVLASLVLLSVLGCASDRKPQPVDIPPPSAYPLGLPGIPLDLDPGRQSSAQSDTVLNGIDSFQQSAGAAAIGNNLRLGAGPGGIEYAIYQLALGADSLVSAAANINVGSGESVWFGLANYSSMRWEFSGPYGSSGTASLATTPGDDYSSLAGNCYAVVVACDSTVATISSVTFTTDSVPPVTYSISGTVTDLDTSSPMEGVMLTVSPGSQQVFTGVDGSYSIPDLAAGDYSVIATFSGYGFNPGIQMVTLGPDATGVNFGGNPDVSTYSISGRVTDSNGGVPLAGVSVSLTPAVGPPAITDGNGDFSFTGVPAGIYTLTPFLAGYNFAPGNLGVTVGPDAAGKDFVGTQAPPTFSVSGTVTDSATSNPMSGVLITVNPGNHQATTNGSGDYTVGGLVAGSYTVTPSFTDNVFTPPDEVVDLGPDKTGVDFSGTAQSPPVTYTNDTKAIFDTWCIGCHSGGSPPKGLKLDNYLDCKTNIVKILNRLDADTMPPGGGLPQSDKDLIHAWNDDGLIE